MAYTSEVSSERLRKVAEERTIMYGVSEYMKKRHIANASSRPTTAVVQERRKWVGWW
jgi:hypothetical protein